MLTDCLTCQNIDRCDQSDRWDSGCINYKMMPTKNPTNADRIRSMSDEELAVWLYWKADGSGKTKEQWLEWLREETSDV